MSSAELSALVCMCQSPTIRNSIHFQCVNQAVLMMMYIHHSLREGNEDVDKNNKKNTNEKAYDTNIKTDNDNKDYAWS